jgi:hypothetical protein
LNKVRFKKPVCSYIRAVSYRNDPITRGKNGCRMKPGHGKVSLAV